MRTTILLALAVPLFMLEPDSAQAQSVARASVINRANALSPACSANVDPGTDATLAQQQTYWESIQACLSAHAAQRRFAAIGASASVQADELAATMEAQELEKQAAANLAEVKNQKDFLGWSWGVGFGVGIADDTRVEEASIVDGVVRSTKETSEQARVFLEYHWYPERWQDFLGKKEEGRIVRAQGPFVAVASRDDKVLSGVGAGWSIGWRDENKSEGFGISLGLMLDNDVNVLADGFEDGEPPPNGETVVRKESKSRISYVLFFTRSF